MFPFHNSAYRYSKSPIEETSLMSKPLQILIKKK